MKDLHFVSERGTGIYNQRLRVVRISHSGSVSAYRERERQLVSKYPIELKLIIPERWDHLGGSATDVINEKFEVVTSSTFGTGSIPLFVYDPVKVFSLLRAFKPHVVDVHEEPYSVSCFELFSLANRVIPRAARVFYSAQNILKRYPPPFSWMERFVYQSSNGAYPCSTGVADVLREKGFHTNVKNIPLGVDTEVFKPKETRRSEFGLTSSFVIGYFGRLESCKGTEILMKAFARLSDKSCQLLLVGSGAHEEKLRALSAELAVADRTVWTGGVSIELIPDYINSCDVIVVPSCTTSTWKEQFGRVVVEAMACGVPVVSSDSGSLPEVVGTAGLVVPEKNVDQLFAALSQLIESKILCEKFRRMGIERVNQLFTWDRVAEQTFELYRQALANKFACDAENALLCAGQD